MLAYTYEENGKFVLKEKENQRCKVRTTRSYV